MPAGRPRIYSERFDTTVSVEKQLWDLAKSLGITLSEAVSYGLQVLIEAELRYKPDFSSDDLTAYLNLKRVEMESHARDRSRAEAVESKVQSLIIQKREEEETNKDLTRIINVWDYSCGKYVDIRSCDFNPDFHQRR